MGDEPAPGKASFEDEFANVERVVGLLERGELGLEEAIRQYESGNRSLQRCYQLLEAAQKKIEVLTRLPDPCSADALSVKPDGAAWTPLDPCDELRKDGGGGPAGRTPSR